MTIPSCTSSSLRTATFTTVGATTVQLQVRDSGASSTATTTVTVASPDPDQFHLDTQLDASVPAAWASVVDRAAARWDAVIKTGLPDEVLNSQGCFGEPAHVNTPVDDLLIYVIVVDLGAPVTLGLSGPCDERADGTPFYGVVRMNSEDLTEFASDPQLLLDALTHEMGHVVAYSPSIPRWFANLNTSTPGAPVFTGPAANGIYQALGGSGQVPLANSGHFSASVFNGPTQGLIMTQSVNPGVPQALGALTAAALADVGYGVDLGGAEPYSLPSAGSSAALPAGLFHFDP